MLSDLPPLMTLTLAGLRSIIVLRNIEPHDVMPFIWSAADLPTSNFCRTFEMCELAQVAFADRAAKILCYPRSEISNHLVLDEYAHST